MNVGRDVRAGPPCVAFVIVVILTTGAAASHGPAADGASHAPEHTLHIRLTVVNDLPPSTRAHLTREAEAIWRREGIRLEWLSGADDRSRSGPALRVLIGRLLASAHETDTWPVGRLLPDQSGGRIAIASIPAAQRVLASAGFTPEPSAVGDQRLGLVLGRAVAHEIGHYLFGTRSHTRRGLMRARIDARDFADLREGGFFLDGVASRWLRGVLSPGATPHDLISRFRD